MNLSKYDPEIYACMQAELQRQQEHLELIASENFASPAVIAAMGSHLTNKYAEGYPGARYYGGCEFVDRAENIAIERAKTLFGAEHANVQAHSGSNANLAAYFALVKPGDTVLGMSLRHGGHLTHGSSVNLSGKYYRFVSYGVDAVTERIDYDELRRIALQEEPKLIVAGASAYPRAIDFATMAEIAKEVGAYFMADMAHIAGLVAGGAHESPVPYADVVTTTTHKTLRGPRGGLILCKEHCKTAIDKAVFPGTQGGPFMHIIASKAVCLHEAMQPAFAAEQHQTVANAKALAAALQARGIRLVSGGTDNHLICADVSVIGCTGLEAENLLGRAKITINKNTIPYDKKKASICSGIRLGTPAMTTRGMKEPEMERIGNAIADVLLLGEAAIPATLETVAELTKAFPLYMEE
ncbi:MAG: serine hydroxymethyltransferase [Clostridiales bacterium]|nr:serine hydroxymethyltransferase [Clostridiales bacterium]